MALVVAVAAQGGYYGAGRLVIAVVLLLALVGALRGRPWSREDALRPPGLGRLSRGQRDALAAAAVTVGALAAASGWVGVAWRVTPWALEDRGLWRAATTLTYANAAAGLLVPLTMLAVARLAARATVGTSVAACLLLTGAGATLSRGGFLGLAVGTAVLATLLGHGRMLRAAGPPAPGAVVALAGLAPSVPAGSPPRTGLAAAALAAGLGVSLGAARLRGRLVGLGVVAAVLAAGAVLTVGGRAPMPRRPSVAPG